MMSPILSASALSPLLIGLLVKGTLLMGVAWLCMLALKRSAAATRHAAWALAFGGLLVLPLGAALLPTVSVPLWSASEPQAELVLPADPASAHALPPASYSTSHRAPATTDAPNAARETTRQAASSPIPGASGPSVGGEGQSGLLVTVSAWASSVAAWSAGRWVLVVWAVGALGMLGHLVIGLIHTLWLIRGARPVAGQDWHDLLDDLCAEMDVHTPVRLLRHDRVLVPMIVSGPKASTILLPSVCTTWTAPRRRLVLLHELAHVKRHDVAVHLMAEYARALHWPNPLVHMAARQLLIEREKACDDAVLATGADAPSYAETLVDTARSVLRRRAVWTGALAMAQPSELKERVVSILTTQRPMRASVPCLHMAGMVGLATVLVFTLAAVVPGPANESGSLDFSGPAELDHADLDPVTDKEKAGVGWVAGLALPAINQAKADGPVGTLQSGRAVLAAPRALRAPHKDTEHPLEDVEVEAVHEALANVEARMDSQVRTAVVQGIATATAVEAVAPTDTTDDTRSDTALSDDELDVQEKAVHALAQLPREQSVPRLIDIARTHPSGDIREKAVFWLGQTGGEEVVNFFDTFLSETSDTDLQEKIVSALPQLPRDESIPRLINIAETHPDQNIREKALFWLGRQGGSEVISFFDRYLERSDVDADLQGKVIFALAQLPDEEAVPRLVNVAQSHPNPEIRKKAIFYLGQTDDPRAIDALMSIVEGN